MFCFMSRTLFCFCPPTAMSVYAILIVLLFARFYEKDLDRSMVGIISSPIICSQMKACLKKYVIIPR